MMDKSGLLYKEEVYTLQGAIFDVYREMGCGFLEAVYQECLEKEFQAREIPFASQQVLSLEYKGNRIKQTYQPDFICFNSIIIELKAVKEIAKIHEAQLHNYLKASSLRLGLLVNFGHYPKAQIKRIII